MDFWQSRGITRARAAMVAADENALQSTLSTGLQAYKETSPAGAYLYGAGVAALEILRAAEDQGLRFSDSGNSPLDIDLFWMRFQNAVTRGDTDALPGMVATILGACRALIASPGVSVSQPAPVAATEKTAEPTMKVEIVAMPARTNLTEIVRDGNGNIISTSQTQTDDV